MIAHTSAEAYHSLSQVHYIAPQEKRVVDAIVNQGIPLSRQMISELTGIPLHCVCGRVHSLLDAGVLEEHGTRIDPKTRKPQKMLRVAKGD